MPRNRNQSGGEGEDEVKQKRLEKIMKERKPGIVIQVPGFSNMNSGPMSAGTSDTDDTDPVA